MRKATPLTVLPSERLAQRICKLVNAQGTADATAALAAFRQRTSRAEVDAAVELCIEKQWLRRLKA